MCGAVTQFLGGVPALVRGSGFCLGPKECGGREVRLRASCLAEMSYPRAAGVGFQERLGSTLPFSLWKLRRKVFLRVWESEGVSLEQ